MHRRDRSVMTRLKCFFKYNLLHSLSSFKSWVVRTSTQGPSANLVELNLFTISFACQHDLLRERDLHCVSASGVVKVHIDWRGE